jgi:hypothetical protein
MERLNLRSPFAAALLGFLSCCLAAFTPTPVQGADRSDPPTAVFADDVEPRKKNNAPGDSGSATEEGQILSTPSLPPHSGQALADFVLTIRQDFVTYTGSGEGRMTRSQFDRLAGDGRLPTKNSPASYFDAHDRDKDGTLTIAEFSPGVPELIRDYPVAEITDAFVRGRNYPNKAAPIGSPLLVADSATSGGKPALYLTVDEVEQRISRFARTIGAETTRNDDGKLVVVESGGRPVPFPPGLIPLPRGAAETELREFAQKAGGAYEAGADGRPILKGPDGSEIPVWRWPPRLRPPYLPPKKE